MQFDIIFYQQKKKYIQHTFFEIYFLDLFVLDQHTPNTTTSFVNNNSLTKIFAKENIP